MAVGIETLGSWGPSALDVTAEIGRRIARCTGDVRSTAFLRQRLDIAIQKGNAAAVHGTMAVAQRGLPLWICRVLKGISVLVFTHCNAAF